MVIFIMVARLLYDKGVNEYITAAQIIKNENKDVRFLLLGDFDEQMPNHVHRKVVYKADTEGIIEYLGYRTDVIDIMRGTDCIVHPSFYNEGMSRVLMEALALKKPIITTSVPGCREFVFNGKNGLLCEPKSVESLVRAIKVFLDIDTAKRKEMGECGRRIAEDRYDIDRVKSLYHGIVYRSLSKSYL